MENKITMKDLEEAMKLCKENNPFPCNCHLIGKSTGFCFKHNIVFLGPEDLDKVNKLFETGKKNGK